MPDNLDQIVESSQAECLATGFEFTEGPLWHPEGYLLFVNNRRNLIYRLVPGGQPDVIREDSGSANGLTFDLRGRLIMCEGDRRQMTRMEPDGTITVAKGCTGPTTSLAAPTAAFSSPTPSAGWTQRIGR